MPEKDEPENPFFEFVKKLWIPVAGFIGAVLLIYQLIQIWNGDKQTVTWVIAIAALAVWLIFLVWAGFGKSTSYRDAHRHYGHSSKTRKAYHPFWQWAARVALIVTAIALISGWFYKQYLQQQVVQANQNKVIVVIAQFDGPEETYGLRNQILEQLNSSLGGDKDIQIIPINETVTIAQGSDYARQLGKQHQADLVFWGWYRPTENPNLTLHVENLSSDKLFAFQQSETYKPKATIADLQSFSLQQLIGEQTSALISFLSGFLFYKGQDYETAITRFRQAFNQQDSTNEIPDLADAYFYFASAYLFTNNYQEAIVNYGKAIQLNPQFADAYNNRGAAYAAQGQYGLAIADFTYTLQIDPQYANAYFNRGLAYDDQGQYVKGIADYTEAIQINPKDDGAYFGRGVAYDDQGQYAQAIADYNNAIQINPKDAEVYVNRGLAYINQGQYAPAIADTTEAIRIDPQMAEAYLDRGIAYENQGQYSNAIADYNQAIKINPQMAPAYYNRGLLYDEQSQYTQAITDYTRAIQINPQYSKAYSNRGVAYGQQGQHAQAIADFNRAIQIDPQSSDAYDNRGVTYASQGQYVQAIVDFTQAIQINPQGAGFYNNRGHAYQALGQEGQANADFAKYKELTGQNNITVPTPSQPPPNP